jgi:tetratricopeptide (TPR) repeat protein
MARQQYMAAIEAYREAPANSPEVWDKMGMAWHHLFAMEEARRDYQHALRLRPNYPEALNNLGAVYYAKRDYRKAVKYYRKALRLKPGSAAALSNLGTAYFALGKPALGLDAYRDAFAHDPRVFDRGSTLMVIEPLPPRDRAQQDFCLAQVFAASGRATQAIDYLRRALNEGFADRKKLLEDETLATLRATPAFSQLLVEQKFQ